MPTDDALGPILSGNDVAYVAVETSTGPLVTPLLFTTRDDRIWMVMPSTSAKAKAMTREPRVGLCVLGAEGAVVLQGSAHLLDPRNPVGAATSLPEIVRTPQALGSYIAKNLAHLAGLIGPEALGLRTLAAVRVDAALMVAAGGVVSADGAWPSGPVETVDAGDDVIDLTDPVATDEVPAELADLPSEPMAVIVGWRTHRGPIALPAQWEPARGAAIVERGLFGRVGAAADGPACIVFDATEGAAFDDKAGLILRGDGTAVDGDDHSIEIRLSPGRVTWWRGAETHTVKTP